MRQDGKCVKRDYGYVGCAADVLAHVDRLCSGEPDHKIAVQCRINAGAVDAAALRPFKNRTTATDEKTSKVSSILIVISLVGTISRKSLKFLPPDVIIILKRKCTEFNFGWGSDPDPARRVYGASPDP